MRFYELQNTGQSVPRSTAVANSSVEICNRQASSKCNETFTHYSLRFVDMFLCIYTYIWKVSISLSLFFTLVYREFSDHEHGNIFEWRRNTHSRASLWLGNFTLAQLQKPFTLKCISRFPKILFTSYIHIHMYTYKLISN